MHLLKPNPLYSLKQATRNISLYVYSDKTEFMCFKQDGGISSLNDKPLKLVDQFIDLGSNISPTKDDFSIRKEWPAIVWLSIWKSRNSSKL